eukprot:88122_1
MSSAPQNVDELLQIVAHKFNLDISTYIQEYFEYHQFDKWKDIYDDINNGFDDCCCKMVLFQQLNITNMQQKHNQYQKLKQCIQPQIAKDNIFNEIFNDIIKVFTFIFNIEIAQNILKLFDNVLSEEEFEDKDSLIDDVDEIENSVIITYIIDEIDDNQINKLKQNAKDIISNGLKYIIENKTDEFIQKHQVKKHPIFKAQGSNHQLTGTVPMNHQSTITNAFDPTMIFINNISKQIIAYFEKQFDYQTAENVFKLFEEIVIEEEFDIDSMKDDLDEIGSSIILSDLGKKVNFELVLNHKQRIQDIVLEKQPLKVKDQEEKPEIKDDEKAAEQNEPKINQIERAIPKIKEIESAILNGFAHGIAVQILKVFITTVYEEGFDDESLKDDLEGDDFTNSTILHRLASINEIANVDENLRHNQLKLKQIILSVFNYISYIINIKLFNYNVTKENVKEAVEFLTKYCQNIYKHLMGVAKHLKESDLANPAQQNNDSSNRSGGGRGGRAGGRSGAKTEGTSLSIVKAFDYINRKPITLWLLNLYSQERARKYRNGELLPSVGYTPGQWWKDPNNKFSKYVKKIHPTMATHIEAGVTDFIKRLLPPMNFNYNLFPVICDRLDDFFQYALAFHDIAFNIKNEMKFSANKKNGTGKFQAPIQIDFWIIPQMTKGSVMKVKPYDIKELNGRSEQKQKQSNNDIDKPPQYLTLEIGDIEDILTNPKLGYMKDEDFFVMDQPDDFFQGYEKTQRAMLAMLRKPKNWNERGNRYIFIV